MGNAIQHAIMRFPMNEIDLIAKYYSDAYTKKKAERVTTYNNCKFIVFTRKFRKQIRRQAGYTVSDLGRVCLFVCFGRGSVALSVGHSLACLVS